MKISTKGRYGLRAMVDIATFSEDEAVSIKAISERQKLSENYLEQIISPLKKAGLLVSTRGAKGGYKLSKKAIDISVGDILRVLEDGLITVDCAAIVKEKDCESEEFCATKYVWKKVDDGINNIVNKITLQDMVDEQRRLLKNR